MAFDEVRADVIPEIVALAHHILCVKVKIHFFTLTVEVMKNPQFLGSIQLYAFGTQGREVSSQVSSDTGKENPGILNIFLRYGHCDIFFLNNAISRCGLAHNHTVILLAVKVSLIFPHRHEDRLLKVHPVQGTIVDRDLCSRTGAQAIQQLRVVQKHIFLVLLTGHLIVDV